MAAILALTGCRCSSRRSSVERSALEPGHGRAALYSHLFGDAFDGVEEALDAALGVNQTSTAAVSPPGTDGNGAAAESARSRMGKRVLAT